jgi:hypothetical protein
MRIFLPLKCGNKYEYEELDTRDMDNGIKIVTHMSTDLYTSNFSNYEYRDEYLP